MHGESSGDRDALLLATGKRFRIASRLLFQANRFQKLIRFGFGFFVLHSLYMDRSFNDVTKHGEMGKQIEMLKNRADFASEIVDASLVFVF